MKEETYREKIKRWARFGLRPDETMTGGEYWDALEERKFQDRQDYFKWKIKEIEAEPLGPKG